MELTDEFTFPLDIDGAQDVLSDLELVAPSLPVAMLESADGGTSTGRVPATVGLRPRPVEPVAPRGEAPDLITVAGPPAAKRLRPVPVPAVDLLVPWLVLRRGDEQ